MHMKILSRILHNLVSLSDQLAKVTLNCLKEVCKSVTEPFTIKFKVMQNVQILTINLD